MDAWTSYLGDSHANRLAQQDLDKVLKTLATSTPTLVEESESADLELFSSKMLRESSAVKQQTENQFSSMSSATWKKWVIEQRQEYSQRLKLAHLIRESESLSWATPNTMDSLPPKGYEASMKQATSVRKGRERPSNLREQVDEDSMQAYKDALTFPTPRTADGEGGPIDTTIKNGAFMSIRKNSNQYFGAKLRDAVESFPQGQMNNSTNGKSQESWPTPRANKVHPEITENNREYLANRNKSNLEENVAGHCGRATGKLNPSWVEQLMGLPVGWTDFDF